MKKNKAFTLIELLAVIIILAIVALIATPIVLNVVEDSRETARRSSISGYADGVRYAVYSDDYIYTGKYSEVTKEWAAANVEVGGDKVECEEVRFSDSFETVLHKCRVGKSTKEYCYASGKTYEDCENEEYKTMYQSFFLKDLAQELKKQYSEDNTVGLLKDETGYYYKGTKEEVSNNFAWFGGHLWRVISIDNNNNLTMITHQPTVNIQPANTVWDTKDKYESSYINAWLNEVFLGSMEESDKARIQDNVFNIGITGNINEITTTQKVGLLDEVQYTKAGLKDSYLDIKDMFWIGNRYDTSQMCTVSKGGSFLCTGKMSSTYNVRPVIKVFNLTFSEGEGTLENPYREKSLTNNIADVKVGEYISISTSGNDCGEDKRCLFRVVSKENNFIKVTLNGLLPSTSEFGSSITYTSGNTIDTVVKAFAGTINEKYRYSGTDTTFGIGEYGDGANYKSVQVPTYKGTVGLPVIGEMFTGNDIDISISSTKKFVNVNIIENPTASNRFWTMNAYSTSEIRHAMDGGSLSHNIETSTFGVRPVLFLKNNLDFVSGEGTAENPFILN